MQANSSQLAGKVVLVSGDTGGLGTAFARLVLNRSGRAIPGTLLIGNGAAPATVQVRVPQGNTADIGDVTVATGIASSTNSATFDVGAIGANRSLALGVWAAGR